MRCPHCERESKGRVVESRKVGGQVWRQRICGSCLMTFVSVESTSTDLRFPWAELGRRKPHRLEPKPAPAKSPGGTGLELAAAWSGINLARAAES